MGVAGSMSYFSKSHNLFDDIGKKSENNSKNHPDPRKQPPCLKLFSDLYSAQSGIEGIA